MNVKPCRENVMFINKSDTGKNNLCGEKIAALRIEMGISQRALADRLQIAGLDINKNAIQRIEAGKRFVTDIELKVLSTVLDTPVNVLLEEHTQ